MPDLVVLGLRILWQQSRKQEEVVGQARERGVVFRLLGSVALVIKVGRFRSEPDDGRGVERALSGPFRSFAQICQPRLPVVPR